MQTYQNTRFTLVIFLIYTVFYESLIWGLTASAIYFLNWSEYTVLVAMFLSSSQLQYRSFYVKFNSNEKEDFKLNLEK